MAKKVFTHHLSVPLNSSEFVKIDIDNGDGNLLIDRLTNGENVLMSGMLQYLENQELPSQSVISTGGQTTVHLRATAKGQRWLHLPWAACNGATEWQVYLNPMISYEIIAHSNGGNVWLDLAGLDVTSLKADTGGGNMDVILPEKPANMSIAVKSGAGNVVVQVPSGCAARIQAATGLGKVMVDPPFSKIDAGTYQSPDYDNAIYKIEITANSGAGNVIVQEKVIQHDASPVRI